MKLSKEEVEHIAKLASLNLSEVEIGLYSEQLSDILAYADRLKQVDTAGILPTSSVLPAGSALRADTPRPGIGPEALLKNAPEVRSYQFKIPPVFGTNPE